MYHTLVIAINQQLSQYTITDFASSTITRTSITKSVKSILISISSSSEVSGNFPDGVIERRNGPGITSF